MARNQAKAQKLIALSKEPFPILFVYQGEVFLYDGYIKDHTLINITLIREFFMGTSGSLI